MARTDAQFGTIFGRDFPQILISNRHLASIKAVPVKYDVDGYEAGRVMAMKTSSSVFEKYNDGGSGGVETAVGVLFAPIDASDFAATSSQVIGRLIVGGEVDKNKLVGYDAAAGTDLKARTIHDANGIDILKF